MRRSKEWKEAEAKMLDAMIKFLQEERKENEFVQVYDYYNSKLMDKFLKISSEFGVNT